MARLVNYASRDENRYSKFDGEPSYNSRESLTDSKRIRLLPKQKTKLQKLKSKMTKNTNNKTPETIPTISASIEKHRNKIGQSQSVNVSSGEVTRGRRCPANQHHFPATQSRQNTSSSNGKFSTRKCDWQNNQLLHGKEKTSVGRSKKRCASCCFCWCPRWWLCCKRKCCARICCGCIDYNDIDNDVDDDDNDDDDDIDAKFEQYKREIRLNELKTECKRNDGDTANGMQETSFQSNLYRIELSSSSTASTTISYDNQLNPITNEGNTMNTEATSLGKTVKNPTSIISRYRKYWNWDDSLRSNSDKFLETLEYDMDGEQSLKRTNNKHNRTDASVRTEGYTPDLHVACFTHRTANTMASC